MVKGCHSNLATVGILTKTQSPGVNLKRSGVLITKAVTREGRMRAWSRVLAGRLICTHREKRRKTSSKRKRDKGTAVHL